MKETREIKVRYRSVDRFSKTATFKTLKGAQRFAHKWVGETPEVGTYYNYAVSGDGVGRVTVEGATMRELFPKCADTECEGCGGHGVTDSEGFDVPCPGRGYIVPNPNTGEPESWA